MSVLFWALWLVAQGVGARNAAEEAICQPFLTSHTSPLLPGPRDLAADEDGEFACGLVLQDAMLPVQIRATVHEGLGMLALRHVQMGLQRQATAYSHFSTLAEMSPRTVSFQLRAGALALEPTVGLPDKAVRYLHRVLYPSGGSGDGDGGG
ncbi:hypothetical protein B484DRAFT_476822, partial [Ochromonadaceae sp. CCMP2298]